MLANHRVYHTLISRNEKLNFIKEVMEWIRYRSISVDCGINIDFIESVLDIDDQYKKWGENQSYEDFVEFYEGGLIWTSNMVVLRDNFEIWFEPANGKYSSYLLGTADMRDGAESVADKIIRCESAPYPYGTDAEILFMIWKLENMDMGGWNPHTYDKSNLNYDGKVDPQPWAARYLKEVNDG